MVNKICTSCKSRVINIEGSTIFKCPKCGETEIVRCAYCRKIAAKYECLKCGFEGPN